MTKTDLDNAYRYCQQLACQHYENFPVASVLLPRKLRRPVSAIYAFARTADDFADEGTLPASERLARLDDFNARLNQTQTVDHPDHDAIFLALHDSIRQFNLPLQLFTDLLTAFRQDVLKSRYASFADVLAYCRYSATPVGRLLLHLQGQPNAKQLQQSDSICTALQLINFYQDINQDLTEQNRIYLPEDELIAAGLTEYSLLNRDTTPLAPLLRSLYQRTQTIMSEGVALGLSVPGRLGWEIRAMTLAGATTLAVLCEQPDHDLLSRPRLSRGCLLKILLLALQKKTYQTAIYKLL